VVVDVKAAKRSSAVRGSKTVHGKNLEPVDEAEFESQNTLDTPHPEYVAHGVLRGAPKPTTSDPPAPMKPGLQLIESLTSKWMYFTESMVMQLILTRADVTMRLDQHWDAMFECFEQTRGATALHFAARRGLVELCSAIVDAGADVNSRTDTGRTPLMVSMMFSQVNTAKLLFKAKGSVMSTDNDGFTAVDIAMLEGNEAMSEAALGMEREEMCLWEDHLKGKPTTTYTALCSGEAPANSGVSSETLTTPAAPAEGLEAGNSCRSMPTATLVSAASRAGVWASITNALKRNVGGDEKKKQQGKEDLEAEKAKGAPQTSENAPLPMGNILASRSAHLKRPAASRKMTSRHE